MVSLPVVVRARMYSLEQDKSDPIAEEIKKNREIIEKLSKRIDELEKQINSEVK